MCVGVVCMYWGWGGGGGSGGLSYVFISFGILKEMHMLECTPLLLPPPPPPSPNAGPGMNFFLQYSNFHLGPFVVDKYTAPGVSQEKTHYTTS